MLAFVKGRHLPTWDIEHHAAMLLSPSLVTSTKPVEELKPIPYGNTKLRITEFPVLED
jgi:hypothetical protein